MRSNSVVQEISYPRIHVKKCVWMGLARENRGINLVCRGTSVQGELWYCCCCLVVKSCPTLCDSMDCSPPVSCVPGIFQSRILDWVAISFSRGSCWHRDQPTSSAWQADSLPLSHLGNDYLLPNNSRVKVMKNLILKKFS